MFQRLILPAEVQLLPVLASEEDGVVVHLGKERSELLRMAKGVNLPGHLGDATLAEGVIQSTQAPGRLVDEGVVLMKERKKRSLLKKSL